MSKRLLVVMVAMSVLATSNAFASRARLLVMGSGDGGAILGSNGNNGSFYYDDAYNVFYNPAYVNDFKNWGTIEKSNFPGSSAQGGFVGSFMNWNVGAYFNRIEGVTGTYGASNNSMRPIDFLIGGDMGVKFGLGVTWAGRKLDTDNSDTDLQLRAGVSVADFEPFVHFKIIGKDKTAGGTTEVKNTDMVLGAKYKWGEWAPYAAMTQRKYNDVKTYTAWGLGLGRNAMIAEGARMVYSASFFRVGTSGRNMLPIDFAVEGDVLSWLTVRGGLNYHLVDVTGDVSNSDTTTGRVGATIHVGKADLDWALGTTAGATTGAGAGQVVGSEAGAIDYQSMGIGPGFFTAMGLSYRW